MKTLRIGLIGDCDERVVAHRAIPDALSLAAKSISHLVGGEWLATSAISPGCTEALLEYDGLWCVPGSPYGNMDGALLAIRLARERKVPFLGTCGGFQHALIEYARNVIGLAGADHEESSPGASVALISKLSCSLANRTGAIRSAEGSRLAEIYGKLEAVESYQCNYGMNPAYREILERYPLRFSAFTAEGSPHAFELENHPFFVGTLFQPERAALQGVCHPLVRTFLETSLTKKSAGPAA